MDRGRLTRQFQSRVAGGARRVFSRGNPAEFYRSSVGRIPGFRSVTVTPSGDDFLYSAGARQMHFPGPLLYGPLKFMSMQCYPEWLHDKYTMEGFVSVELGDVVVDCGAFAGAFSVAIQPVARAIHAIEPAPPNFACLEQNMSGYSNVRCWPIGFYTSSCVMPMNISSTYVDNSLLAVDQGETLEQVNVQLRRVDEWMGDAGIRKIDFLKLEAEGLEPEIAESIGDACVVKIAADCGPERDGQRTNRMVREILSNRGYDIRERGDILFARKDNG